MSAGASLLVGPPYLPALFVPASRLLVAVSCNFTAAGGRARGASGHAHAHAQWGLLCGRRRARQSLWRRRELGCGGGRGQRAEGTTLSVLLSSETSRVARSRPCATSRHHVIIGRWWRSNVAAGLVPASEQPHPCSARRHSSLIHAPCREANTITHVYTYASSLNISTHYSGAPELRTTPIVAPPGI
jgi:hypothetical protein